MPMSHRLFLASAAASGAVTMLPYAARAAAHAGDVFKTAGGDIKIHP